MSYIARETSVYSGAPYELYWFSTISQSWYLTSADEAKTYNGNTYTPTPIFHTAASQATELKNGNIKITIAHDHPIALLFMGGIPLSPLVLTIFRAHVGDAETVVYWQGRVTLATLGDDCELTGAPEQEALKKRIPFMKFQRQCNRILGAPGCDIDLTLFRVLSSIATIASDGVTITSTNFGTKPDGWFANGYLEKGTSRRMIVSHTQNTIVLLTPLPGLIVGDTPYAYAGCDRMYGGDCQTKFNNGPKFFGFDLIPVKNPFSGLN